MYYRQNDYGWIPYNQMYWNGFPFQQNYPTNTTIGHFMNKPPIQTGGTPPGTIPPSYPTPYPNQFYNQGPMQPPIDSLFSYFKDDKGNLDLNKMMYTVGQVSNTVKQVTPLFKQFSSLFGKV